MGWFSDVVDTVGGWVGVDDASGALSGVGDWLSSGTGKMVGGLVSTALTGYALHKVTQSINNSQNQNNQPTATPDYGQLITIPPAQDNKIPVLYGRATIAGIITDAVQSTDHAQMTYVLTLSEKTGPAIDGTPSSYIFENIYWNTNERIVFKSDGITADYTVDTSGNINRNISGLVKIWLYAGGSTSSNNQAPSGYSITTTNAYANVPNWTSNHTMNNLIFAVVEITYSRDKGVTGLPVMNFTIQNSLTQPGDVMYDYMTNARYGAGILLEDIYTS